MNIVEKSPLLIQQDREGFSNFLYKKPRRTPDPYYGKKSRTTPCPFYKPGWNCSTSTPGFCPIGSSCRKEKSENKSQDGSGTPTHP